MGIEKIGTSIGKEIIAWTRTGGKSLLAARPVKINTCGLKYAPHLEKDTFQLCKKNNSLYSSQRGVLSYTHTTKWPWMIEPPLDYANKDILYIDKLYANGNGQGTKKIQELVRLSLENPKTEGRVALSAECLNTSKGHPLGFYYKLGFRSTNDKLNKACEQWLLNGGAKELAPGIYPYPGIRQSKLLCAKMYLPRENIEHCLNYGTKTANKANTEYDELLNSVMFIRGKEWSEFFMPIDSSILKENIKIYPNIPHNLKGMLPYCGKFDISNEINRYLSGREFGNVSKESIEKFSKLLDTSLEECDKNFGIFKGIVYRGGYFSPKSKQFYSSSFELNPELLMFHAGDGSSKQFHIIKTKSGHNINAFQEKYCTGDIREQFLEEKEILLSKKSKFQEPTNNPELELEKQKVAESLLAYCKKYNVRGMTNIDEILSKIKIWEEI